MPTARAGAPPGVGAVIHAVATRAAHHGFLVEWHGCKSMIPQGVVAEVAGEEFLAGCAFVCHDVCIRVPVGTPAGVVCIDSDDGHERHASTVELFLP